MMEEIDSLIKYQSTCALLYSLTQRLVMRRSGGTSLQGTSFRQVDVPMTCAI